jgi:hypothetical protein
MRYESPTMFRRMIVSNDGCDVVASVEGYVDWVVIPPDQARRIADMFIRAAEKAEQELAGGECGQ